MSDSVTFSIDDGGGELVRTMTNTPDGVVMTGELIKPMALTAAQAYIVGEAIKILASGEYAW